VKKTLSATKLELKIFKKQAKVGIIGLGYVGSAVAQLLVKHEIPWIGFDISKTQLEKFSAKFNVQIVVTSDLSQLRDCDVICVCVPTPINSKKQPDLAAVTQVFATLQKNYRPDRLIILESSVAPGTTRTLSQKYFGTPLASVEVFIGYSPERIDPGNTQFTIQNTPKIISGISDESRRLIELFYKKLSVTTVSADSLELAEIAKMFENVFRLVNISLVQEFNQYAQTYGISMFDVVTLAKTKPFGYLAHYPGPGVGGHCIPVDPYYVVADANLKKTKLSLVAKALRINERRPLEIAQKIMRIIPTHGAKILIVGLAYKANSSDTRESAGVRVLIYLLKKGYQVSYHDPLVPNWKDQTSVSLKSASITSNDAIVIMTNHLGIDWELISQHAKLIIDTRNVFPHKAQVIHL
jgi:UDP-N-acetyl-D-glucosamine dehydrogenase